MLNIFCPKNPYIRGIFKNTKVFDTLISLHPKRIKVHFSL